MCTPAPRFDPVQASEKKAWLSSVSFFRGVFGKRIRPVIIHGHSGPKKFKSTSETCFHLMIYFTFSSVAPYYSGGLHLNQRQIQSCMNLLFYTHTIRLGFNTLFIYLLKKLVVTIYRIALIIIMTPDIYPSFLSQPSLVAEFSSNYFSVRDEIK